jgi:phospholipid/cholesterol/gamma-HCH transport system substrate-binding protein
MNRKTLEMKVGLFVLGGMVLLAALAILFSKGLKFDWDTYTLNLRAPNAAGLKDRCSVLMSGVPIGSVNGIALAPDGKSVVIGLKLTRKVEIRRDARFLIEQSGMLGDQYVAVIPTQNAGATLRQGDEVRCEAPFNMLEMARNASGLIARVDQTARKLDDSLAQLQRFAFNEQTLSNLAAVIGNMRAATERAVGMVSAIQAVVETNRSPITASVSNLVQFSEQMTTFSSALNELALTNRADIGLAVKDVQVSARTLRTILQDVQAGKGLAGALLKDDQMATQASQVTSNLAITASNLNSRGLWGILRKPKAPSTNPPPKFIYGAKRPFE